MSGLILLLSKQQQMQHVKFHTITYTRRFVCGRAGGHLYDAQARVPLPGSSVPIHRQATADG